MLALPHPQRDVSRRHGAGRDRIHQIADDLAVDQFNIVELHQRVHVVQMECALDIERHGTLFG